MSGCSTKRNDARAIASVSKNASTVIQQSSESPSMGARPKTTPWQMPSTSVQRHVRPDEAETEHEHAGHDNCPERNMSACEEGRTSGDRKAQAASMPSASASTRHGIAPYKR